MSNTENTKYDFVYLSIKFDYGIFYRFIAYHTMCRGTDFKPHVLDCKTRITG